MKNAFDEKDIELLQEAISTLKDSEELYEKVIMRIEMLNGAKEGSADARELEALQEWADAFEKNNFPLLISNE
jgi:hypothetical protein